MENFIFCAKIIKDLQPSAILLKYSSTDVLQGSKNVLITFLWADTGVRVRAD